MMERKATGRFDLLFVIALLLLVPFCGSLRAQETDLEQATMNEADLQGEAEPVRVLAKLLRFVPQGVTYDSVNGSVTYDISVFKVLEPQSFRDNEFIIQHAAELPSESPWRSVGGVFLLEVEKQVLANSSKAFLSFRAKIIERVE